MFAPAQPRKAGQTGSSVLSLRDMYGNNHSADAFDAFAKPAHVSATATHPCDPLSLVLDSWY